jgi:hypothetical protein
VLGSWLWVAFTGENDNYIGCNFWTFYSRKNDISFDDNFLALHRISVFDTLVKFDFNPYCRLYFPHIEDMYLGILLTVRIAHCFSQCQEVQDFSGWLAAE